MNKNELSTYYNTKRIEAYWYNAWEQSNLFSPNSSDSLPKKNPKQVPYVILMPPPNITGILHNGHTLFVTLEDILARYHRMQGKNVLWIPGLDHAGISTQAVVERNLKKIKTINKNTLTRKTFIKKIWQLKEKNESYIIKQLKILGASADWSRSYFTLDKTRSMGVKKAFVIMWNNGLIYRKQRLVNWDPKIQTALSNEEVIHKTKKTNLDYFAYKIYNEPKSEIIVATTRLETMLGDVAIAVNPKDIRYHNFIGKQVKHPFIPNRDIRIIADNSIKIQFGSGAVKITPAHDLNDLLIAEKHKLPIINIFTKEAKLNKICGEYSGLDKTSARKTLKQKLIELKLYRKTEEIEHNILISQRSNAEIEPMLSKQYFINMKPLAKKAIKLVKDHKINIIPKKFIKTWNHFLINIEDWCISRQILWGHQIPIFYNIKKMKQLLLNTKNKKNYSLLLTQLLKNNANINKVLNLALLELDDASIKLFSEASITDLTNNGTSQTYYQEQDVLDTWFSSALLPFSALGWPNNTKDLEAFYPGSILETGSDILFFWVAKMTMLSIYFMNKIPFKDIILHSMIVDSYGKKMSKSNGNTIDPVDIIFGITLNNLLKKIETYPIQKKSLPMILQKTKENFPKGIPPSGADSLRLTLAILSCQEQCLNPSISKIKGYKSFLNKIWNATRFALININTQLIKPINTILDVLPLTEQWILSELQLLNKTINTSIEHYMFSEAANKIYHFFWIDFCDWYLEFAKNILNSNNIHKKEITSSVIIEVLDIICRLLHPFCPYITEEIWNKLPLKDTRWKNIKFCAIAPFPHVQNNLINNNAKNKIKIIKNIISIIRSTKQQNNIPLEKLTEAIIISKNNINIQLLKDFNSIIKKMAYLNSLKILLKSNFNIHKNTTINFNDEFYIILPLQKAKNKTIKKHKLLKQNSKIIEKISILTNRLNNNNFLKKAKKEIINLTKEKLKSLLEIKSRIQKSISIIKK